MEFSSQWLSELENDEPSFFHQFDLSPPYEYLQDPLFSENYGSYFSFSLPGSCSNSMEAPNTGLLTQRPPNNLETQIPSSCTTEQVPVVASFASPPRNISFRGAVPEPMDEMEIITSHISEWNFETLALYGSERVEKRTRPTSCTQDHVIAERNRREKLSQLFIALSAIIPDLKKTDKASLLGDAINYVKQLETKVKALEEQAGKKTEERASLTMNSDHPSSDEKTSAHGNPSIDPSLKIEARLTEKTVLIRIQCKKHKGVLVKVLSEIEKLHLSVISTSVMPFEGSLFNMTVIAKIEENFSMTVKDLLRDLTLRLSQFK